MLIGLKVAILKSGKSQRQIGAEICIPENRFSQIVRGWRSPTAQELARIAAALDRDVKELLQLSDEDNETDKAVAELDAWLNARILTAISNDAAAHWWHVKCRGKRHLASLPLSEITAAAIALLDTLQREASE